MSSWRKIVKTPLNMRVCVMGGTGSVGRCVVRSLLQDSRVTSVVVVMRKELSDAEKQALWAPSGDASKLAKVEEQVVPSFDDFLKETESVRLKEQIRDRRCTAYISCVGLYSTKASEQEMRHLEVDINRAAAEAAAAGGASVGGVLSGTGAKAKAEGGSSIKFAKIKGEMEDAIADVFPGGMVTVRPGGIHGREGTKQYGIFETMMNNSCLGWLADTKYGITAEATATGLVQALLFENPSGRRVVLENNDIKLAAARYQKQ